jgi:hypothetical protein
MVDEMIGFGGLNLFGVVILIELIIICIIRLDRFVRILKDLDGNDKKVTIIFNVQGNKVICKLQGFFSSQWDNWI